MRILFDDSNMGPLTDAFKDAPLSESLREALWAELSTFKGPDGFLDCGDVTALETGDWRVLGRIGRAGEFFMAAFRALALARECESHDTRS
jgi:hypothetical protein